MTDLGAGFFFHITHFLSYFGDCILWNCHKVSVTKKRVFSYKRKDNSALFFGLGKNFPIWKEMVSLIFRLFLILSLYARCLGVTNNMPQKPSPLMADSPSPSCSPPVKWSPECAAVHPGDGEDAARPVPHYKGGGAHYPGGGATAGSELTGQRKGEWGEDGRVPPEPTQREGRFSFERVISWFNWHSFWFC